MDKSINEHREILKKERIDNILDYLFELSFQMDKEISAEDNIYEYLFEILYDMFEEKHMEDDYCKIMRQFLFLCVAKNKEISVNVLIDSMKRFSEDNKEKENFGINKLLTLFLPKKRENLN